MTNEEAIEVLTKHNAWRRCEPPYDGACTMPIDVKELGLAIDYAIEVLRADTWKPFKKWHDDYGDCVIAVYYPEDNEWCHIYSSPLSCDWNMQLCGGTPVFFYDLPNIPPPQEGE